MTYRVQLAWGRTPSMVVAYLAHAESPYEKWEWNESGAAFTLEEATALAAEHRAAVVPV